MTFKTRQNRKSRSLELTADSDKDNRSFQVIPNCCEPTHCCEPPPCCGSPCDCDIIPQPLTEYEIKDDILIMISKDKIFKFSYACVNPCRVVCTYACNKEFNVTVRNVESQTAPITVKIVHETGTTEFTVAENYSATGKFKCPKEIQSTGACAVLKSKCVDNIPEKILTLNFNVCCPNTFQFTYPLSKNILYFIEKATQNLNYIESYIRNCDCNMVQYFDQSTDTLNTFLTSSSLNYPYRGDITQSGTQNETQIKSASETAATPNFGPGIYLVVSGRCFLYIKI